MVLKKKGYPFFDVKKYDMNRIRAQISLALEALIEERNGLAFQRIAIQCLRSRWPSLASVAEQADLGEDAVTILDETSNGIVRTLACSLSATWQKVSGDAKKISSNRSDIKEIIFATPKTVTRKMQQDWGKRIKIQFGWNLIVIDRTEFLAILERPESQWICKQNLNVNLGYLHLLKTAEKARESDEIEIALHKAEEAERGALDAGDWETICRAQILQAEMQLDVGGISDNYRNKASEALSTAKENNLTSLIAECLALRANSILGSNPQDAQRLLEEAESVVEKDNRKIRRWICIIRAELEQSQGNLENAEEALCRWKSLISSRERIDYQGFNHIKFRINAKRGNHIEALNCLNKALQKARLKKRWMSIGWMLHEKARYFANRGEYRKGANEADKARKVFEKTKNSRGALDSALLSGYLFFECRLGEKALSMADYVLSRPESKQYQNIYQDALQLKARSLQILNKVDAARDWNQKFREYVSHNPQAIVVADIQDAMLFARSGDYNQAESMIRKGIKNAKDSGVQKEIIAAINIHWAQIKMDQAKYREARALAEDALRNAEKLPLKVVQDAEHIIEVAKNRAPLTSIYQNLLNNPSPLRLAGTEKSRSIQGAHQEIIQPLIDWVSRWPSALQEIYDFWGRGNLARFILNHRGYPDVFHITVEATKVSEARLWAVALCPLVDVLTILWKGPVSDQMVIVPVRHDYSGPGGWGYSIAAGTNMRPDDKSDDWNWSPAMGWATLLPRDASEFLFVEARTLFESGRLFLLPALNIGCIDDGHGPLERMFNEVANAESFLSNEGSNCRSIKLESFPIPYFPEITLSELGKIVEDEGESLLKTRIALRNWARSLKDRNEFETKDAFRECYEQVKGGLNEVQRKFKDLARRLEWAQKDGNICSYVFDAEKFKIEPESLASAELTLLYSELHCSAWYAYFRLSSQGYRWDLLKRKSRGTFYTKKNIRPDKVHHWLVPPKGGWTIPTVYVGDIDQKIEKNSK